VKLFKPATDFSERMTRYQVEHIGGKRGPDQYTCPMCTTLKTHESATSQMRSVKQSGTPSATTSQNHEPSPTRVQNANPTEQLIRRKFQEYYLSLNKEFYIPPHPEEREYGSSSSRKIHGEAPGLPRSKCSLRAIRDLVPAHVYFSTAYYQEPTAPWKRKAGKELI